MEKIVEVGSWRTSEPSVEVVRVSRRGLRGADRDTLLKRADHAFAEFLDRVKVASDELPIHVLAVHATEAMGPNRNGDGFTEATCRRYHHTFVKYARHYEHHRNKDPRRSYGDVRLSVYNEPMRRIELLVIGNLTKDAARRNGGLVLPSNVVDKLERGEDVGWSMACKVAFDVCSICGNRAPSRAQYCTEETCVDPQTGMHGHGCRGGLMKLCEDGRLQFVDNPEPTFFDISRVSRPADRQAYGWKASYLLTKTAAAQDTVVGGAELAELLREDAEGLPYGGAPAFALLDPYASRLLRTARRQQKLASVLASMETQLDKAPRDIRDAFPAEPREGADSAGGEKHAAGVQVETYLEDLRALDKEAQAGVRKALADAGIVLDLSQFLAASGLSPEARQKVASETQHLLPRLFRTLADHAQLDRLTEANPYAVDEYTLPSLAGTRLAAKLASVYGMKDPTQVRRRLARASQGCPSPSADAGTKTAEASADSLIWALRYGLYKLATLVAMGIDEGLDGGEKISEKHRLIARLALLQNRGK